MPNRIIRESCRTSATLYQLTHGAERMFWRLTTVADDFGRFEADPRVLLAQCFPLWAGRLKVAEITRWYSEMERVGLVTSYVVNAKYYGYFETWDQYQRRRNRHSKYPAPTDAVVTLLSNDSNSPPFASEKRDVRSEKREARNTTLVGVAPDVTPRNGHVETARALLAFLNLKAGRSFRPVPATLRLIEARLKGGATLEECRGVIARQVRAWGTDPKMAPYLRPETLFNATKFESYRGLQEIAP